MLPWLNLDSVFGHFKDEKSISEAIYGCNIKFRKMELLISYHRNRSENPETTARHQIRKLVAA